VTPPIILIAHAALGSIIADARRYAGRKERGGIFLGLRRGQHLHISEATLPMRWDWGTAFAFRRSARGHQEVALRRWRESAHTTDWVGEWHSHPEAVPSPSGVDLNSWRRMTDDRGAPMAFLIVGYDAVWVGLSLPGRTSPHLYVETERSEAGVAFQQP
jgi:integrative and conjugative element protein (TIGR02256 family)